MDEIFSYFSWSFCPTTVLFKLLSSVCFGTCLSYYRSSSEISSHLAIPSYLRVGHGKAIGSPGQEGRVGLLWVLLEGVLAVSLHWGACLGLVFCSDWSSQRRLYQFPSWRVIFLLVSDLDAKGSLNTKNLNFHLNSLSSLWYSLSPYSAVMSYGPESLTFTFFGEQISTFQPR